MLNGVEEKNKWDNFAVRMMMNGVYLDSGHIQLQHQHRNGCAHRWHLCVKQVNGRRWDANPSNISPQTISRCHKSHKKRNENYHLWVIHTKPCLLLGDEWIIFFFSKLRIESRERNKTRFHRKIPNELKNTTKKK